MTDIFTKRGITPPWDPDGHVARAQRFERYNAGEREKLIAIESAYASPDVSAWFRWATTKAGWVMPRFAPMPDHEDSAFRFDPVAQLRPDEPLVRKLIGHQHSGMRHLDRNEALQEWPSLGGRCACGLEHSRSYFERPLRNERRGREQASPREAHEAKVNTDGEGHLDPETGEVVVPIDQPHVHVKRAKYLYTPGDTAKRLGASPLSIARRFEGDDPLLVVMEGTLKMCAVTEAGYPCIDAGSVTLWASETESADVELDEFGEPYLVGGYLLELAEFAERYLHERNVAVVCDSDWYTNPLVRRQTEKVASILNARGARAIACAPPEGESQGWRHRITGREMRRKLGVDDWLGEYRDGVIRPRQERHDAVLDLVFQERIHDALLTVDDPRLATMRRDGAATTVDVVRALGDAATPDGLAYFELGRIADRLDRQPSIVKSAFNRAANVGLVDVLIGASRRRNVHDEWFTEPSLIRVAEAGLPAYRERTLRDWL